MAAGHRAVPGWAHAAVVDRTGTAGGYGGFAETRKALEELWIIPGLNLITTVTKENVRHGGDGGSSRRQGVSKCCSTRCGGRKRAAGT